MKLSAVRVFVNDLVEARNFYADQIGLRLQSDSIPQGYCVLDAGGAMLIVEPVAADAPGDERGLVGRFVGVSFAVDDIHAEHRRLLALGVGFPCPPERQAWGGTLATFTDPSGNRLQLVQYGA